MPRASPAQTYAVDDRALIMELVDGATLAEHIAAFSPDGRWIAYTSSEAVANQIFVRPFPNGPSAGKWQISNGAGGSRFPWRFVRTG